ncbi:MAG: hypothetical protein H6756_02955 [Candidatus Omnitrophica bacterium]|nr:hypothetical protein [Chlamydiia bacterium]MCB9719809.1 hypothetical protein [Candidatus Omnitrophota bacterium]
MKPDVKTAMESLIKEARDKLPFDFPFESYCEGRCEECPFKLMEFLDMDLSDWKDRLQRGETPTLNDLHRLGRDCKEIHDILQKKGFIKDFPETHDNGGM